LPVSSPTTWSAPSTPRTGSGLQPGQLSGGATATQTSIFVDDLEGGNLGWTFPSVCGTLTTDLKGCFEIGDPVGTTGNYGSPAQPENDHTPDPGVNCIYSAANSSAGVNDIDNGEVVAISPVFDGTGHDVVLLDMWRWFFNEDADDASDYFIIEVTSDGSTWVELENLAATSSANH
jgi:hypothetical protein